MLEIILASGHILVAGATSTVDVLGGSVTCIPLYHDHARHCVMQISQPEQSPALSLPDEWQSFSMIEDSGN